MTQTQQELPGKRLLRHLNLIASQVFAREAQFLQPKENQDLESLLALPEEAGMLLCRLLDRKEGWLLQSSLVYEENPNIPLAMGALLELDWVESWPLQSVDWPQESTTRPDESLTNSLDLRQSRSLLQRLGQPTSGSRADLQARLHDLFHHQQIPGSDAPDPTKSNLSIQSNLWPEKLTALDMLHSMGPWVRLKELPIIRLAEMLFFGDPHLNRNTLLLEDIGIQRFENLGTDCQGPFTSRHEIDLLLWGENLSNNLYEESHRIRQELRHWRSSEVLDSPLRKKIGIFHRSCWKGAQILLAALASKDSKNWLTRDKLRRIAMRFLGLGGELLERIGRYKAALNWQAVIIDFGNPTSRSRAMSRSLINLKHLGEVNKACDLRKQWLSKSPDPLLPFELGKTDTPGIPEETLCAQRHLGWRKGKALVEGKEGAALCVEEFALEHFANLGWEGLHQENILIRSLIGVVFWDLVFAKNTGEILHTWQGFPRDWQEEGFLNRRQKSFQEIVQAWPSNRQQAFERVLSKQGIANPLINWASFERWPALHLALKVLGEATSQEAIADLGTMILGDSKRFGKGMPDLFLWKDDELLFAEVKGTGDTLSPQQRFWLQSLNSLGFKTMILHVKH